MLKLGAGDWEQETGNYIVYFHENRDHLFADMARTSDILVRFLTLKFVTIFQKIGQFLKQQYLPTYFCPGLKVPSENSYEYRCRPWSFRK